jgi:hypothetical protein
MDIEMTYGRAFKVWWSYVWRALVLSVLVSCVTVPLMIVLMPHVAHGERLDPDQLHRALARFALLWPLLVIVNVLLQVQAMRWMLKTRWSDFRLAAMAE